ncbi:MAG: beta-glucosidase BglX [Fusicatenibacter sp.]|nr:beta-glucosidase BglX [Lachnospiraceae bacterium]MDY2938034.1 beta-glucosidase BglX [Fusicatenibacter sp.]
MEKQKLQQLLADMSLKEKVDQMLQLSGAFYLGDENQVLTGPARDMGLQKEDLEMAGSILGAAGAKTLMRLQDDYMKKQPHHIPMLFMMDVIHGMKTIFPMPLAQGATFHPELSKECAHAAAKEASVMGLHVTFSPMVDLVRDARWGRVMESTGEDPYLNSCFAKAMVEGFQGENPGEKGRVASCVKHFAGYGGAQAGRDYNTVELSEHTFREFYLPAYQAGIDAGAELVMTSFNTINGIPASTNKWLMRDVLRGEMGFDGVLISDFSAILETVAHRSSADECEAAVKALEAGVDIDMMTSVYSANLCRLVEEGKVQESLIDEAVGRILELKNKLGLFENPYKDADPEKENEVILCEEHRALARKTAAESFVLLKNDGILPLDLNKKIAFVGPYTENQEIKSSWSFTGDAKDCVTVKSAAREVFHPERTSYHNGCPVIGRDVELIGFTGTEEHKISEKELRIMEEEALTLAKEADLVVMPLGEHYLQSGEASSRAMLDIPEIQMELFRKVCRVNPNVVVVLFSGRPLDLREISAKARAILEVWFPGTEGGHAIVDVLTGKSNPSGKLPMSFPYCVGQVPVHYNEYSTGRPNLPGMKEKFRSKYLDIPNAPLYPFGYGLSYTDFEISPVRLDQNQMDQEGTITARVTVKNIGNCSGTEVVQLYLRDNYSSVVRPVKELKGFKRVTLLPGEEKEAVFVISEEMLRFYREDGSYGSEKGTFRVMIGNSSTVTDGAEFELV